MNFNIVPNQLCVQTHFDPQFMGAIGAAVFAMEKKKAQPDRAS
jgi:activator of 2-hydroxyglutaryl-CoA dehydratase